MKKENGVLLDVTEEDLELLKKSPGVFWEGVTRIGDSAFSWCPTLRLNNMIIPEGVIEIGDGAFFCSDTKSVVISKSVTKIGRHAFCATNLKSIVIPESVTEIGRDAFFRCSKLKEITLCCKDGNKILKADHVLQCLEDIGALRDFVAARDRHNKTFLPASQVILNTPKDMVENFYSHSKNWGKLLSEFAKSVGKSPKDILDEPKADFYKLCLISGVFSEDQKERDEAMRFVEDKIIGKFDEGELHERFTGLETKENGYNPEYAKFLRLNFDDNFMMKDFGGEEINYFASSYNRFKEIQEAYPNREVVTNTDNDRLTPDLVEKYLQDNKYSNVTEETKELAELCGFYGYSQGEFEVVSGWLLQGKQAKREGKRQLFCSPDEETREDVVTYEFLEKDNPLGAVLGDITNCCQKVGDAGQSCCKHGMTDPKGGFVVFKKGGKIVGQSWVWYNQEMGKVCLDNVEVPRSAKSSVMHGDAGFIDCMRRLKDGFVEGMSEHKLPVSYVTMGEGYNDILDIARSEFAPVEDRVKSSIFAAVVQSASQQVLVRSGGAPIGVYTDTGVGERWIK